MSDKVVDSVVESAMALKEIAIENAKTELMNELSPKITKLFDEKINESSKKILSEQEDDEDAPEGDGDAEAEVDLDDLAKEIEQEDGEEGTEGGSVEDKVEELEQKVDAVEVKVDDVKEDVAELKGEEPTEEGEAEETKEDESDKEVSDDEELEIEDDSGEEGLEESVDIDIKDNDVRINVDAADDNTFVDIVDDTPLPEDDEYVDIVDDSEEEPLEDVKENRRMRKELPRRESRTLQLEHRINVLKRALNRASKIIVNERMTMKKVENILSETKLLNEKLVLVNRIFARYDLNKDRKYRVLEAFDKATNSKESVVVYRTILEQLDKKAVIKNSSTTPSKVTKLQESMKKEQPKKAEEKKEFSDKVDRQVLLEAARPTGVLPPSKIVDADRMKKLAGIE
jgi:hypothetical protein